MSLASGKGQGEVHSSTCSSIRHNPQWKEATVSPKVISKKSFGLYGPHLLQLVLIPALKPF